MKKQNYWLQLPSKLKEDLLNIDFGSVVKQNKAIKFIHILRNKAMQDNYDTLKFIELSSKWFRTTFNSEYLGEFLNKLVAEKIIEVNDSYSTDLHYSKSYRINSTYFNSIKSYSSLSYSDRCNNDSILFFYSSYSSHTNVLSVPTLLPVFKNYSLSNLKLSFPSIEKKVIYDMVDTLNIDYVSIINKTRQVVDSIDSTMFKVDEEVEFDSFEAYNRINHSKSWFKKEHAISYIRKAGLSLIQDKDKVYIDDLDRYVETKKKNIYSHYTSTFEALKKGIYHVNRNMRNARLDTIFTSMCSHTLDIIKKDNDLIEIDLVNSQYAILANWLLKEDCIRHADVKLFCELAINGNLYEYVAEQLNIDRKQAKKMMMVICFSSHLFNSDLKRSFKELFPNVYNFIQSFKKQSTDSSEFAVELQKRESKIFIDGLLKTLIDEDVFVLTKHDSLIIRRKDKDNVLGIVRNHFMRQGIQATVKADGQTIHNGVLDTQIQDQTNPEYKCQAKENGADNGVRNTNSDFEFLDKIERDVRFQYNIYVNDKYKQQNGIKFPINHQHLLDYIIANEDRPDILKEFIAYHQFLGDNGHLHHYKKAA